MSGRLLLLAWLVAARSAQATLTVYTTDAGLGPLLLFSGNAVVPPAHLDAGAGSVFEFSAGELRDQVVDGPGGETIFTFDQPVASFGGFFDLSLSSAGGFALGNSEGLTLTALDTAGAIAGSGCLYGFYPVGVGCTDLGGTEERGVFGFASTVPLSAVVISYLGTSSTESFALSTPSVSLWASNVDAGTDAGATDAGASDADAGPPDAGTEVTARDAGEADRVPPRSLAVGCGCGQEDSLWPWLILALWGVTRPRVNQRTSRTAAQRRGNQR